MFADDTTLYVSHKEIDIVLSTLQNSINDLTTWAEMNHMCLHPKKSKFMLITTRQKRQNLPITTTPLYILNTEFAETDCHKILGIEIDNNLSWCIHVSTMCKNLSKKIFQLSKIKHFLNFHSRKIFFHAYIESVINYTSNIWDSASAKTLKPLSKTHNST